MENVKQYYSGISFGFIACFFYAVMDALAKLALSVLHIPFFTYYFYTNLTAFFIVIPYILYQGIKNKINIFKVTSPWTFVAVLASLISFTAAYVALARIPLDIFYSIIFTTPLITAAIGIFVLKEPFTHKKAVALSFGTIGIVLITNPYSITKYNLDIIGIMAAFVITIADVLIGTISRKFLQKEKPLTIRIYLFILGSLIAAFILSGQGFKFAIASLTHYGVILGATVCLVIASLSFLRAYQSTPTSLVSTTYYSFIIWGVLLGYFMFNELPTITTIVGCLLIIIGNMYLYFEIQNFFKDKIKKRYTKRIRKKVSN